MNEGLRRIRTPTRPPRGFESYLSRRQAAASLGFPSDFKLRQFEKEDRLHPVRGAMGSAFYPPAEIAALRDYLGLPVAAPAGPPRQWSDGELIARLRAGGLGTGGTGSVADLVVDTGITIDRAEKVYRFWQRHDTGRADATAHTTTGSGAESAAPTAGIPLAALDRVPVAMPHAAPSPKSVERRGAQRLSRAALIQQMRDPDPRIRADAFNQLRVIRERKG